MDDRAPRAIAAKLARAPGSPEANADLVGGLAAAVKTGLDADERRAVEPAGGDRADGRVDDLRHVRDEIGMRPPTTATGGSA